MYKALNPSVLGISGRQSEIVELALTHGFRGIECDINEFAKRAQTHGIEKAKRFLESAHLKLSGFELPLRWRGDEIAFQADLEKMEPIVGFAAAAGAKACHTTVMPATDMFPYHENFELHRKRLGIIAESLAEHGICLGLVLVAAPAHRVGKSFQFIYEVDSLITLLKSISSNNLGLILDTWNWHFSGGNLGHIKALGPERIVGVRIADAPADATAETLHDEQRLMPNDAGAINVQGVVSLLAELGYKGPLSLDPHGAAFAGMSRDSIVQRVSSTLDELLKLAGISKTIVKPSLAAV